MFSDWPSAGHKPNFHIKLGSMNANIKNPSFKKVIPRRWSLSKTDGTSKPVRESTTGNGVRENKTQELF